jgi:hypothetical protein
MPESYPPEDPREWLNRAKSNLYLVKSDWDPGIASPVSYEEYDEALSLA